MNSLSTDYLTRAEIWLLITTLTYFLMNGAQIFETIVIIPKWTSAPPESFQILKGKYAPDLKSFWIGIHSVHEITFILAIVFCWQIAFTREWLLVLFAIHFCVRIWTIVYFAPNIIEFQRIANTNQNSADLIARTMQWKRLNYLRVGVFVAISFALVLLCFLLLHI
ncbi:MAG: transposase [Mucilaginibacter sp.]|nr:transposase [Mucilaginibacter sp.]